MPQSRPVKFQRASRRGAFDWRTVLVVAVWLVVLMRIASEFSGRGAPFWHWDLAQLSGHQENFYRGLYPPATILTEEVGPRSIPSDYPPYSFLLFVPWLPPGLGWHGTQWWFSLCQVLAVSVIATFAWRSGRTLGKGAGWLSVGAVLAMTGLRADLLFGNCAAIMLAMLIWMHWETERGRLRGAAAAWLVSLTKPQMGWLFGLIFWRTQAWRMLLWVAAAIGLLVWATYAWTGVSPLVIFQTQSSSGQAVLTMSGRHSLVSWLHTAGMPVGAALVTAAGLGVVTALAAWQKGLAAAQPMTQFAFIGVVNRVCTYHNGCDDLLLVFALVWLARRAWAAGPAGAWIAFLALGLTAWAPTVALQFYGANAILVTIWTGVAGWIWWHADNPADSSTTVRAT